MCFCQTRFSATGLVLSLIEKLDEVVLRLETVDDQLMRPGLDPTELRQLTKERARIAPIVEVVVQYREAVADRDEYRGLLADDDPELKALAKAELKPVEQRIETLEAELSHLLRPRDPDDDKEAVIEVRAGTGGDEAALFGGELFQMYVRFAQSKGWKVELVSQSPGTRGGLKEAIATISGDDVFGTLRYESGVHRVQRVPATESQGRIHTSACTVAVLPVAEEVDLEIDNNELRIDVFRASGPGGQSVNTTDSAVRITHLPTGLVVQCQDEKSQHKNKAKAMHVLRARLYDRVVAERHAARAAERKAMVQTGDRSEKIRTYNFPQDRCTDHRVGLTAHNLPRLLGGELADFLADVRAHFEAARLEGTDAAGAMP